MERHRILFLGGTVWLCWFSLYVYVPILPTYVKDIGTSYDMIGLVLGSYGLAQMALRLPLGILSDWLNKRKLFLLLGMAACVLSGLGMWQFHSVPAFIVSRSLAGVAASAWVIQTALFVSYYRAQDAPKATGAINSISNFGEMTAMLVCGVVAYSYGPEQTFLLGAIVGMVGFALGFAVRENETVKPQNLNWADIKDVFMNKSLNQFAFFAFLVQFLTFSTIFGFVPIAARNIGANNLVLGLLPTMFMIPSILSSALSGTIFVRRFGEKTSVIIGFLGMALPCAALPFITSMSGLLLSQIVNGFFRGLVFPLLMGLSIRGVDTSRRATALGYFQAVYGLGMFAGPVAVGALSSLIGLNWGFWTLGAVGGLGCLSALVMLPSPLDRRMKNKSC